MEGNQNPKWLNLIEHWVVNKIQLVTTDDVRQSMGAETNLNAARRMIGRLKAKGFLEVAGYGVYKVHPLSLGEYKAQDPHARVAALAKRGVKFYVGFNTAAGYYRWTPDSYGTIMLAVRAGHVPNIPDVTGTKIKMVDVDKDYLEPEIVINKWEGYEIPFSSKEKTIVDVVDKEELVGGYAGCLRILERTKRDRLVDWDRVAEIASEYKSVRLCKRLGWLVEKAGIEWSPLAIGRLKKQWPENHGAYLQGDGKNGTGKWNSKWQIIINVPEKQLEPEVGIL
jgi:predicted transcriptional regulator of viral defense system